MAFESAVAKRAKHSELKASIVKGTTLLRFGAAVAVERRKSLTSPRKQLKTDLFRVHLRLCIATPSPPAYLLCVVRPGT